MHRIHDIFRIISARIENHPAPLIRYVYLFFAILAVRLSLEFFSSHRLFTFPDVIHIGLWFMFIVLAFIVQLHLFSGVPMARIIRLCVVGFSIALSAPLIDLMVSGGVGAKMNYLSLNSWNEILVAYITVGGPSLSRGATLGIRIEIALLVMACFTYVFHHTRSILRAFAGSLSIYTVLFLSGGVPRILQEIEHLLSLQYSPDDISTSMFLLVLDLMLLCLVFFRLSGRKVLDIIKMAYLSRWAAGSLLFAIGALQARTGYLENWALNMTTVFWFPLLGFIGISVAMMYKTGPEALVARILLPLVALSAAMISLKGMFICSALWGILFLRDAEPLKLGKIPLVGVVMDSLFLCGVAIAGFVFFGGPMVGFPPGMIGLLLAGSGGICLLPAITRGSVPWPGKRWLWHSMAAALLMGAAWLEFLHSGSFISAGLILLPLVPALAGRTQPGWYLAGILPALLVELYRIA